MVLGFTAPDNLAFRRYLLHGTVVGPGIREKPINVEVVVNAFQISTEDPRTPGTWKPVGQAEIKMLYDRVITKKIRVRTQLGDRLTKESLKVTVPGPFANDDGDRRRVLPKVSVPAEGGKELEVSFEFNSHGNADPHTPYRVRAYFECPELGLRETFEFVIKVLETPGRIP